jgi:predicted transcriptional regulator
MDPPLDRIRWLLRSESRIDLLHAVDERPRTASELLAELDVSRVTVNRMIEGLADRDLVSVDAGTAAPVELTPVGRLYLEDVRELRRTGAAAETLAGIQTDLPDVGFDLRRLADASVVRPQRHNTVAPQKVSADTMLDADRIRVASAHYDIVHVRAALDHLRADPGAFSFELIFLGGAVRAVGEDREMAESFRELDELGEGAYYVHPEEEPFGLSLYDERVAIELTDGAGVLRAVILSDDEAVAAWGAETFERYRRDARQVDVDELLG